MEFEPASPPSPHGLSTTPPPPPPMLYRNSDVDSNTNTALKRATTNIELVLPVLQELQRNPRHARELVQVCYPLTSPEYRSLLDIIPDLKDLRNIWGQLRYVWVMLQLG